MAKAGSESEGDANLIVLDLGYTTWPTLGYTTDSRIYTVFLSDTHVYDTDTQKMQ